MMCLEFFGDYYKHNKIVTSFRRRQGHRPGCDPCSGCGMADGLGGAAGRCYRHSGCAVTGNTQLLRWDMELVK